MANKPLKLNLKIDSSKLNAVSIQQEALKSSFEWFLSKIYIKNMRFST